MHFKEMYLIFCAGGIEEFRNKHMDLCDSSIKSQEARPLYSPTTPIIEPQIETATASQILPFLYLGKFYPQEIRKHTPQKHMLLSPHK